MNANAAPARSRADGRNYPLNCWWVAATAAEVGREPLGRWLLDRPVVLYRTEAGEPVALDNRCIHRWAPLSEGYLEGDRIVCAYHGARFGPDGRCARYPTQDTVPDRARVRSYAVVERGPFIWIWMGDDQRRLQTEPPPDFAWATAPGWTAVGGGFLLEANYMLLHENVLDLTHFNYLHRDSFQITNRTLPVFRVEGDKVFSVTIKDFTDTPADRRGANGDDPSLLRHEEEGAFVTPALHMTNNLDLYAPGPNHPERVLSHINHMLTPESPTRSHYWWIYGTDEPMTPEAAAQLKAFIETGFNEDKVMLAAIQAMIERDPRGRDYPELNFSGDTGGVQARRALDRILAKDDAVPAEA